MGSRSLNKVLLIGHLGADPEIRYLPKSGKAVANFRIATNEVWTDPEGRQQERTEWHRIVAFGRLAEFCGEYLAKGKQVYVEGRLRTREWTDQNGQRRFTTEIIARSIILLGAKGEAPVGEEEEVVYEPIEQEEEDVPF